SRRRHTRSKRDWSSDVCSSDLSLLKKLKRLSSESVLGCQPLLDLLMWANVLQMHFQISLKNIVYSICFKLVYLNMRIYKNFGLRSEERRVGKECRCRGSGWR